MNKLIALGIALVAAAAVLAVEVPAEYAVGEYVDMDPGCYFDTGFRPDECTRVVADVTVRNPREYWFGAWNRDYNRGAFCLGNDGDCIYAGYGDEGGVARRELVPNGRHVVELDAAGFRIDGKTCRTFRRQEFRVHFPLYIGAQNRSGIFGLRENAGRIRLHALKIFEKGELIRHYVPVRKTNGTDGLFDRVGGIFLFPLTKAHGATAEVGGGDCVSRAISLPRDYACAPVGLKDVAVTGGFWLPRVETNRLVTVWDDFKKCEETGRIRNFELAAERRGSGFSGIPYNDSDVYKVIEGACYILATHPDEKLEKYIEGVIAKIAGAQEPDGYLYTARTLQFNYGKDKNGLTRYKMMGPTRWSTLGDSHELYNVAHMYEAAVAHYQLTGRRTFLNVAIRNANLIDRTFGTEPGQLRLVPGIPNVELALVKLYRVTGDTRYLNLSKRFLDMRGDRTLRPLYNRGVYSQDHQPLREQSEVLGHAVCAAYLYSGMTDVAVLLDDADYARAVDRLWASMTGRKLHISGGIGAWWAHVYRQPGLGKANECFAEEYELPNENAYLETCAAIANAFWNERLFLKSGDAKYMDVVERIIYNGFLSGISISGNAFFYQNPLASRGKYGRSRWFGTSCCPVNIVRFIPQIAQYAYATKGNNAYVNLFLESTARLKLSSGIVSLVQRTNYPWDGRVTLTVEADSPSFTLNLRVPGWCTGCPVPSDLYTQTVPGSLADYAVKVNGESVKVEPVKGYCSITRAWKAGDRVEIAMNMPVRRIRAHEKVAFDRGRLAVERGPLLYCAEGVDNGGKAFDAHLAADATFAIQPIVIAATPMTALVGGGLTLVPYFAWNHRGAGEMQTWFLAD